MLFPELTDAECLGVFLPTNRIHCKPSYFLFADKPRYKGPAPPPNRFNILPGYRWDGVDRYSTVCDECDHIPYFKTSMLILLDFYGSWQTLLCITATIEVECGSGNAHAWNARPTSTLTYSMNRTTCVTGTSPQPSADTYMIYVQYMYMYNNGHNFMLLH